MNQMGWPEAFLSSVIVICACVTVLAGFYHVVNTNKKDSQ